MEDFITVIDLESKKKTLKELIKNTYKENEFTRDMLATLYNRKAVKYAVSLNRLGSYFTVINPNI